MLVIVALESHLSFPLQLRIPHSAFRINQTSPLVLHPNYALRITNYAFGMLFTFSFRFTLGVLHSKCSLLTAHC